MRMLFILDNDGIILPPNTLPPQLSEEDDKEVSFLPSTSLIIYTSPRF